MKVAVVTYPGSHLFSDIERSLQKLSNVEVLSVWHKDDSLQNADLVLVPGGCSFGDYLRPGALAKLSPISGVVMHFADSGGRVIGIGNGFQILCELDLLPGAFFRNPNFRFCSSPAKLKLGANKCTFTAKLDAKYHYTVPLACNYGRYFVDSRTLEEIENNEQIVFQYANHKGKVEMPDALTGSVSAIAALTNRERNVLGILAHPERAVEPLFGSTDGLTVLSSFFGIS